MEIKRVPISEVEVWDKNPRNIKTKDFERLKRQIQELGVYKPLICFRENGKYTTLGGNMRLCALMEMGTKEVEISIVSPKTEAEKIKYALSDNDRVGEYDEQALAELTYPHIEEINLEDYRIDVGEPISLKDVIEDYAPDIDGEDEIPEIDDSPAITKMGDLFQLGKHRLLCGDATKEEDVKRLMGGEKADMVFTSPPYNVGKRYSQHNDKMDKKYYLEFLKNCIENIKIKKGRFICWNVGVSPHTYFWEQIKILIDSGYELYRQIVWEKTGIPKPIWQNTKNNPVARNYKPNYLYELILLFVKEEICMGGGINIDNNFSGDVWHVSTAGDTEPKHPSSFPTRLIKGAINHLSEEGEIIIDIFSGSGSTMIASEATSHICYSLEIDPKYCDVIITRFSNFADIPEKEIRATRRIDG